jgi:hypothetical protein
MESHAVCSAARTEVSEAMQRLLRFFTITALGFVAVSTQAKTVEYPAGNPLFKFELPDGWTTSTDGKGNLDVKANDKSDFDFSIVPAAMGTGQDIKAFLPDLAKMMGKDMEDLQVDEIAEMTTKPGMKVMILNAKGKAESSDMVITLAAFAPVKDKYFIIMSVAEKSVDQAHDKPMGEIVNSIELIK